MTGAEGPIAAFLIVLAGIAVWKATSWGWGKVSKPKGYAIVAVTAAGVMVLPVLSGTSEREQVEALRNMRTSLAERGIEVNVSPDKDLSDPSTSPHTVRARARAVVEVTRALEAEDYVVSVVDADELEAALETPSTIDDQSLFPKTRSVWESEEPTRGLAGMVGVVPHEPFEPKKARERPASGEDATAGTTRTTTDSTSAPEDPKPTLVDLPLGEEPTTPAR